MTRGVITNIQRFSLNDGPGIRTTVFLKGCDLHCTWCHNPETYSIHNELLIYPEKCIGCGHCVAVCPTGARKIVRKRLVYDRAKCTNCGKCAEVCFPGALENSARSVSVEEVMREIVQDKAYYADSKGGVTLSGGEAALQADFAAAIADACRKEGIACAIETNLAYDFAAAEKLLKKLDLIMFDVKLMDAAAHLKYTGQSNERVLENVRKADALGIPLIARTPLIPGVTATADNVSAIAGFLAQLKHLEYYELLNFNPLGASKFAALGLDNPFAAARPLPEAGLKRLVKAAEAAGVTVKLG